MFTEVASLISSPSLVNGLVGVSAKAALVLLGALAVTTFLRRAAASTRHQVWAVTLVAVLALPALTLALPALQLPVLPPSMALPALTPPAPAPPTGAPSPAATSAPQAPSATTLPAGGVPTAAARPGRPAPAASPAPAGGPAPAGPPAPRRGGEGANEEGGDNAQATPISGFTEGDLSAILLAAWMLGVTAFLARLLVSTLAASLLVRRAAPLRDAAMLATARAVRADLGLVHEVRIVESDRISMPMAWGLLRPAVVLPATWRGWSGERRRVVLLHEMAHLRRRDCQTLLLARLVTALHWFNPLAWTATHRLQAERERACDDLVLSTGTSGADYAQHLLDIARGMRAQAGPGWAAVAMARPNELEGRLLAILDPARKRHRGSRVAAGVGLLAAAALVLPLAALQPQAVAEEEQGAGASNSTQRQPDAPSQRQGDERTQRQIEVQIDAQLEQQIRVQRERRLQLDVQPHTARDLARSLPLGLEGTDGQRIAAGLAEGLGDAVAEGLAEAGATAPGAGGGQEQGVNPRVMQAFASALQDENPEIRAQAAQSLGQIESADAVSALVEALRNDSEAGVRSQAAWALGMIESDEAVPALTAALADPSENVRDQAVWALGMIESVAAVPALMDALQDESSGVRGQAVWALGMIESQEAVPALIQALDDESADIRSQAVWALGMIESDQAVTALAGALSDAEVEVRSQAAWALGMIESAAAVEALSATLRGDESPRVRKQAAWALGMIEDESALDGLLDAMTDEDLEVRKTAFWAVAQISG